MTTAAPAIDISARLSESIRQLVGERKYTLWFQRSADFEINQQHVTVYVPNQFVAQWMRKHFMDDIQQAADALLEQQAQIAITIDDQRFSQSAIDQSSAAPRNGQSHNDPSARHGESGSTASANTDMLPSSTRAHLTSRRNPSYQMAGTALRHDLDEFVVGPSNDLAYAAANRLCDTESQPLAPLFIHGGCGLGKTHLLQGVCKRVLTHQPGARVLYTTGEQFTNEYLASLRSNRVDAFRRRMRRLDLLAVDDVHFLANKQATQQEFLHSFDDMDLAGARVILASDSHPKLIDQFSDALVSRCVRGLVVEVKTPDMVTRRRLIQKMAQQRLMYLPPNVLDQLAQHVTGSVREIQGMMTKLHALVSLAQSRNNHLEQGQEVEIKRSHVERLLGQERPTSLKPVQFQTILDAVCDYFQLKPQRVAGSTRTRNVVIARTVLIYLTRQMTSMSYPEIASAMGKRNHSTLITAVQRMERQLASDDPMFENTRGAVLTSSQLIDELRRAIVRMQHEH